MTGENVARDYFEMKSAAFLFPAFIIRRMVFGLISKSVHEIYQRRIYASADGRIHHSKRHAVIANIRIQDEKS